MTSQLNVDTIADKAGTGTVGLHKQEACKARALHRDQVLQSGSLNHTSLSDN